MIEPKDLYRKLAALLENIDEGRSKDDFLYSVISKLEHSFGMDLHIGHGCLYTQDNKSFFLVEHPDGAESTALETQTTLNPDIIQMVHLHKSYIFDDLSLPMNNQIRVQNRYFIPAAFIVHNPEKQWIFVFTLESGWIREEVEFCLNAVRTLLNYRLHSEVMNNSMQQAALIQQSLLPSSPPQINGFECAGRSLTAELVGGDFFDFAVFNDDAFSVAVGDASGHGLPAALMVRDVVTALRMGVEKNINMAKELEKLNRVIHRSTLASSFVSLFYAEIDNNDSISYVNAGHPPPLLILDSQVRLLEATGLILGAVSEISLEFASTSLKSDAVLVMYSDGLLERFNNDEHEFGLSKLSKLIIQHQYSTAQEILDIIYKTVFEFGDKSKWQDDVTVVVIKKLRS